MDSNIRNDKIIHCQECGQEFVWTLGEQGFYEEKGLREPVRCPMCRATYKAARKDKFRGKIKKSLGKRKKPL